MEAFFFFTFLALIIIVVALVIFAVQRDKKNRMIEAERQQKLARSMQVQYQGWKSRLDKNGCLPTYNTNIRMEGGEVCYYCAPSVTLYEGRAIRDTVHAFTSVSIARGVRVGGGIARSESHQEWRPITSGTLYVTNKKVYFNGELQDRNIPLSKVGALSWGCSELRISSSTRQKGMVFAGLNGRIACEVVQMMVNGTGAVRRVAEKPKPRELTLEERLSQYDKKTSDGRFVID